MGADPKEGRGRGVVSSASYEAYLDLSGRVEDLDQAANLARTIMQEILDSEGLSCSVGVAPNKMLAKIGSDFRKPFGLTVISELGAKEFLSPLGVRKIPGVGPRTEEMLLDLGIRTSASWQQPIPTAWQGSWEAWERGSMSVPMASIRARL